jgi:hypothetical protein
MVGIGKDGRSLGVGRSGEKPDCRRVDRREIGLKGKLQARSKNREEEWEI